MKIYNNNCKKKFTKIKFPITLKKTHSGFTNNENFFDIECNYFCQEKCYIFNLFVERMQIRRIYQTNKDFKMNEPKWDVEIIIPEYKDENEAISIASNLCYELSLQYSLVFKYFQHGGFKGFEFQDVDVKRSYSNDNKNYGDTALNNHCGMIEVKTSTKIKENIFKLPEISVICNDFFNSLRVSFINALKTDDDISRFLLLYYLFEIIFETSEYKNIEKNNGKRSKNKNLLQFLSQMGIKEYYSYGKSLKLSEEILLDIINTRNNLTHRADTTRISTVMYYHMLPILQQLLNNVKNNLYY